MKHLLFLTILCELGLTGICQEATAQQPCDTIIYSRVDQMPQYEGGIEAFEASFTKELAASHKVKKSLKGTVYVTFVINCQNEAVDFKVLRSLDKKLDEDIISVLQSLQHWTSCAHVNEIRNCSIHLAIRFDRGKVTEFSCPTCHIDPALFTK